MKQVFLHALASSVLVAAATAAPSEAPARATLPEGFELVMAAAPPLVNHPIMGCLDDRGRLFVGDAAGVNLDKAGLQEQLPNRVLLLKDIDGDGNYDSSTVFADRMTFPQGAVWLNGSLYVASPPGIWKLTDTNDDGVADVREMLVGGFDYTGNAADVHGPFLHPGGRLYWLHGRKGHKVVQQDGTLVHEGLASGVWSFLPDGSDIQWHALASADNPTEIDFTPEGEIIGTCNLFYNRPRSDTLMHWLYGGVYERPDQLQAVADLPRTLKRLPIIHDFGHVAVSGCTFYRSGALDSSWKGDMFVTHFNTQKLKRMKLTRTGATYEATEHDFLKLDLPDAHLTDVFEDADGSLIVLDTGGWFRNGCPTSIMEKPELKGAVYRIRKTNHPSLKDPYGLAIQWDQLTSHGREELENDPRWMVRQRATRIAPAKTNPGLASLLSDGQPQELLKVCDEIAKSGHLGARDREALLDLLGQPLDDALEHGAMFAGIASKGFTLADLRQAKETRLVRRLMQVLEQAAPDSSVRDALLEIAKQKVDSPDPELVHTAVQIAARHPQVMERSYSDFKSWLDRETLPKGRLNLVTAAVASQFESEQSQQLVSFLLNHKLPAARQTAWRILAAQTGQISNSEWLPLLDESLTQALQLSGDPAHENTDVILLLGAIANLQSDYFDAKLQRIVSDEQQPEAIRLKALAATSPGGKPLEEGNFTALLQLASNSDSITTRIEASRLLATSHLKADQMRALAPLFGQAGPVELRSLLLIARRSDEENGRAFARSLAESAVLGSIELSIIKTSFGRISPEIYEGILAPALHEAEAAIEASRRNLKPIAEAVETKGRADHGKELFESGRGTCVACHKIADTGRSIGPDLSTVGRIRNEQDIVESIFFPSSTLARDFETHVVETTDGETLAGMIRSRNVEGLLLVDVGGQEHAIRNDQIVTQSTLPTSLMPMGLQNTLNEQELLDLVAWLSSLE